MENVIDERDTISGTKWKSEIYLYTCMKLRKGSFQVIRYY